MSTKCPNVSFHKKLVWPPWRCQRNKGKRTNAFIDQIRLHVGVILHSSLNSVGVVLPLHHELWPWGKNNKGKTCNWIHLFLCWFVSSTQPLPEILTWVDPAESRTTVCLWSWASPSFRLHTGFPAGKGSATRKPGDVPRTKKGWRSPQTVSPLSTCQG